MCVRVRPVTSDSGCIIRRIDMKSLEDHNEKQEYTKPKLTAIELAADEILAVGCKLTTGIGSGGTSNVGNPTSCTLTGCVGPGS